MKKYFITLLLIISLSSMAQVAMGTTSPNARAVLDLVSTTQGFLPPRMTQVQRNTIASPVPAGLIVWCIDCGVSGEIQVYNGTTWTNFIGAAASATVPSAPTSIVATSGDMQASIAFVTPVNTGGSDITGYTVTSSSGSLTVSGTSSPILVTGLNNGTTYTFTVVATNSVGSSVASVASNTVTPSVFVCGNSTVTFMYKSSSVTYGTVVSANSKCWLDRNLGATRVAASSTDAASSGDLFQWGRGDDGHQTRTSGITSFLSTTDTPDNSDFIIVFQSPADWRQGQNSSLWQGVNGTNNPCPKGYRVPTQEELAAEFTSWNSNNSAGAYASPLKLPVTSSRQSNTGIVNNPGYGFYWSSTSLLSAVGTEQSGILNFYSTNLRFQDVQRSAGAAVRCLKD